MSNRGDQADAQGGTDRDDFQVRMPASCRANRELISPSRSPDELNHGARRAGHSRESRAPYCAILTARVNGARATRRALTAAELAQSAMSLRFVDRLKSAWAAIRCGCWKMTSGLCSSPMRPGRATLIPRPCRCRPGATASRRLTRATAITLHHTSIDLENNLRILRK
jgi:hypothetical protein